MSSIDPRRSANHAAPPSADGAGVTTDDAVGGTDAAAAGRHRAAGGPLVRLAGGLAHGFNNLLTVLRGNTELLRGTLSEPRQRVLVDAMLVACSRAHALTQQLLTYSGQQLIRPRWLDLNAHVGDWLERHRVQLPGDVDVRFTPCQLPTSAHVDPAQLSEVLSRLIVTSCDAILAAPSGRGCIDVRTERVRDPAGVPAGEYVRLVVAHDGLGMDASALAAVFEPYGSVAEFADGTDFGLATVAGILRQNRGAIRCTSAPDAGATFESLWPLRTAGAVLVPRSPAAGRGELVVLVDDDPAVRQFAGAALRERGYDVVEFDSAAGAMQQFLDGRGAPAMLITDVVMPGIDGKSLAALVRQRHPALPVLYVSGYSEDVVTQDGLLLGDIPLLEKPFSPDELALAVRALIDAAAER